MKNRFQTLGLIRAVDAEAGIVESVISTGDVARDDAIILTKGWQLGNYKRNPVVLWSHMSSSPPIGRTLKLTKGKDALEARAQLDMEDPQAAEILRKIAGGFINATSVRWLPIEFGWEEQEVDGATKEVLVFRKQELLEWSFVSIPADPGALIQRRFEVVAPDAQSEEGEGGVTVWSLPGLVAREFKGEEFDVGQLDDPPIEEETIIIVREGEAEQAADMEAATRALEPLRLEPAEEGHPPAEGGDPPAEGGSSDVLAALTAGFAGVNEQLAQIGERVSTLEADSQTTVHVNSVQVEGDPAALLGAVSQAEQARYGALTEPERAQLEELDQDVITRLAEMSGPELEALAAMEHQADPEPVVTGPENDPRVAAILARFEAIVDGDGAPPSRPSAEGPAEVHDLAVRAAELLGTTPEELTEELTALDARSLSVLTRMVGLLERQTGQDGDGIAGMLMESLAQLTGRSQDDVRAMVAGGQRSE